EVLHFRRPGGWHSVTNFGGEPVELPAGTVLISSAPLVGRFLPANTTVWLR
ncbi:MAG: alpha-glucosidase, partial [Arthrobacter sp.]